MAVEVLKALKLVAPVTMTGDAQLAWVATAVDALEGIRAAEVAAISAELRRTVTRPAQIVPEIARLVADRRSRRGQPTEGTDRNAYWIERGNAGLAARGIHDAHWIYDSAAGQYRIEPKSTPGTH